MVSLKITKLASPTLVGEILKKERENKKLTLEEAARSLDLSPKYLKILEMNAWERLPGQIYAKSFIKKYARFLELNDENLFNQYLADQKKYGLNGRPDKKQFHLNLGLKYLSDGAPFVFRRFVVSGLIIVLAIYLSYEVSGVFRAPYLTVDLPAEERVGGEQTISVKGKTEPEARIQINGKEVVGEGDGAFATDIGLREGVNIIKVSATKRHGGTSTVLKNIVVQTVNAVSPWLVKKFEIA